MIRDFEKDRGYEGRGYEGREERLQKCVSLTLQLFFDLFDYPLGSSLSARRKTSYVKVFYT
jgi:hypothetical protein